jgi:hypothetical protein
MVLIPTLKHLVHKPIFLIFCNFKFYEWVYYRDHGVFPINKETLGRVLGPLRNEGNEMEQIGKIIPRRTLRRLHQEELTSETEQAKCDLFDKVIHEKLGDSAHFLTSPPCKGVEYEPDENGNLTELDDSSNIEDDVVDPVEQPMMDLIINSEVHLPQGEEMKAAKVTGRALNEKGELIGEYNENPILNTLHYNVEFPNGETREYGANIIAENMYAQVDTSGNQTTMLDSILNFEKDDNALSKSEKYITNKRGCKHLCKTTDGYKFQVLWRDGSSQWVSLAKLKESNPVEVAKFAVTNGIDNEPAFAWWVPFTLS